MSEVNWKRVGELQGIARENLISVTNIIRDYSVKGWMGNPKLLLQVLWERGFMDTVKDVFAYYNSAYERIIMVTQFLRLFLGKLCVTVSTLLRRRHYFKLMLAIWYSIGAILLSTVPPNDNPNFLVE